MGVSSQTASLLKTTARAVGFDLVGIAPAEPIPEASEAFFAWLGNNYEGDMTWIRKDPRRRTDPRIVLPGAQSVICLAVNYFPGNHEDYPVSPGSAPVIGKVARYAWGKNYHTMLEKKMKALTHTLTTEFPENTFLPYVDHGPILERAYAPRRSWLHRKK